MVGVALGLVLYPLIESKSDVINSDWPVFATGAKLIVQDPTHLYNFDVQRRTQLEVTGGRSLVGLGVDGLLPFLAPAFAAFLAVPFEVLGTEFGGRLWILFGLACLALGLLFAVRPRPPRSILPAFASVPTALLLLNGQLDGLVALGIGSAIAIVGGRAHNPSPKPSPLNGGGGMMQRVGRGEAGWRPFLAGLALGLTLVKPQLVLPLGAALILTREWRVLAGWAAAGIVLFAAAAVLDPRWVVDWLPALGTAVQPGVREVDFAHLGTLLPGAHQGYAVALLSLLALIAVLALAGRRSVRPILTAASARRSEDFRAAAAVLVAGGVLAAPHALPTDLVLVAVALAIWGEAIWADWLALSIGAMIAAVAPAPLPVAVGVLLVGWLCLRVVGLSAWPRGREPVSAR